MSHRLGRLWSCRQGRKAIRRLLALAGESNVDPQVRVNALSAVLQVCGEDVTEGERVRAVGFVGRGGEE